MNEIKETKILKNSEVAQPDKRTEQIIDDFDKSIKYLNEALADKDKTISELKEKITDLEAQNNDLDYLLNSGRNKFEHERNKRLNEEYSRVLACRPHLWEEYAYQPTEEAKAKGKAWKFDSFGDVVYHDELGQDLNPKQEGVKTAKDAKLVKISGILTSNIRSKPSSDTPFMAFLWLEKIFENPKDDKLRKKLFGLLPEHENYKQCANSKCKDCEIPVIFRIKEKECTTSQNDYCLVKPKLKKGDSVILEGKFASSDQSKRPSFTAYSYQIL